MDDKLTILKDVFDMIVNEYHIVCQCTFNIDHIKKFQSIYGAELDQITQECGFENAVHYEQYIASIDQVSKAFSCAN